MDLVRDRDCSVCTACCRDLAIDDPALSKPAAELCTHCVAGQGCAIYASWPSTCREWHCGSRLLPWMAAGMRPDLSGLLVLVTVDGEAGGPSRPGLVFNVLPAATGAAAEVLARPASLDILGALVREGVPVFLGVKDASGRHGVRLPLNGPLASVAQGRDGDRMKAALLRIYMDVQGVIRGMEAGDADPSDMRPLRMRRPGMIRA